MRVRYTSSLWSHNKGACGKVQKLSWKFKYLGLRRCIPWVYHFKKGIVFDLLTFLDACEMEAFNQKYAVVEHELTPIEQKCAEQDHPFRETDISEIYINDSRVEQDFAMSGAFHAPFIDKSSDLLSVKKAYHVWLGQTTCFHCQRFCVPYPKAGSPIIKLLRALRLDRVQTLKLRTREKHCFYPVDQRFTLSENDEEKTVSFVHPLSGVAHTLYLKPDKPYSIPQFNKAREHLYALMATYEIVPPLHPGDQLVFDSSFSYRQTADLTEAASIGIIGGADGPTAIFVSGTWHQEKPVHLCSSVVTAKRNNAAEFVLQGIDIKTYGSEVFEF